MARMVNKNCEWCHKEHTVRAADLERGWGRFCGKVCKAMEQEKRTGQHKANKAKAQARQQRGTLTPGHDALLRMLDRHKRYMVMVGDDGKDYIDPDDDGIPEDDF